MKVYIVVNNSKACYDAGGIFFGVYASKSQAEADLAGYTDYGKGFFEILEEEI